MADYFRPRGDITTVLDLTDRDSQDNTYFPLNTDESWFHRGDHKTVYPSATSVQEFTQREGGEMKQAVIQQVIDDTLFGILMNRQ